jgi:colanic acid biosynthesis glycosyl transferase WcaI
MKRARLPGHCGWHTHSMVERLCRRRVMHVLAMNQFYAPDVSATSQLLTQLCESLVARGHDVTVIASRGAYLGGERLPSHDSIGGVDVRRAFATSFGKETIAHRLGDYLSFFVTAIARASVEQRPDVILALTTPPMVAAGAVAVARARGVPLVTWVQDVYPDVAMAFGLLSDRHPAYRALGLVARATHLGASRIVALSDGMSERLSAQGAPRDKLHVIGNWSDGEAVAPIPHERNPFRREHGLVDRFCVMYSGNLGVGHDVQTLVDAARLLAVSHPRVVLLFVGEGTRRREAEERARGLANVRFLGYQPSARLAESLSAADVHVASLRPGLEGLLVPSKLYGVLAAGRPLLYVGPESCEVTRVIRQYDLGRQVLGGQSAELAAAIAQAHDDPAWTTERGARARTVFLEHFDRKLAVARWESVLRDAAGKR